MAECKSCKGTANCTACDGKGDKYGFFGNTKCERCDGKGKCTVCNGSGKA